MFTKKNDQNPWKSQRNPGPKLCFEPPFPPVQHGEELRRRLATDADAHLTNEFHEPRGAPGRSSRDHPPPVDGNLTENPGNLDGKNGGFDDLLEKNRYWCLGVSEN